MLCSCYFFRSWIFHQDLVPLGDQPPKFLDSSFSKAMPLWFGGVGFSTLRTGGNLTQIRHSWSCEHLQKIFWDFIFGRHCEQMRCWSSQQKRGREATSVQTGHSSSSSRDAINSDKIFASTSFTTCWFSCAQAPASPGFSVCASLFLGLSVSPSWILTSFEFSSSSHRLISSISCVVSSKEFSSFFITVRWSRNWTGLT